MTLVAKSSHRKYANAKSYYAFKDGKLKGIFPVEWKMTDEQLKSFLQDVKRVSKADTIVLHWTARDGIVDEKVVV